MNFPVEKREHENQPPAISSSSAQGLGSSLPKWWGGGVYFPSFISLFRCLLISLRRFIVFCRSRHSTKSSNSILHSFAARVAPIPCAHSIHSFSKAWHRAGILWGCSALWIVIHWSKSMPSLFCTSKKGMASHRYALVPSLTAAPGWSADHSPASVCFFLLTLFPFCFGHSVRNQKCRQT